MFGTLDGSLVLGIYLFCWEFIRIKADWLSTEISIMSFNLRFIVVLSSVIFFAISLTVTDAGYNAFTDGFFHVGVWCSGTMWCLCLRVKIYVSASHSKSIKTQGSEFCSLTSFCMGAWKEYILGGKGRCDFIFSFSLFFPSPFSMCCNFLYLTYPLLCELVLAFKFWFRPSLALHLEVKGIVGFSMSKVL